MIPFLLKSRVGEERALAERIKSSTLHAAMFFLLALAFFHQIVVMETMCITCASAARTNFALIERINFRSQCGSFWAVASERVVGIFCCFQLV